MTKSKNGNIFSGWFQINTIKNYKIFRRPFKVNTKLFEELRDKHFTREFTSKHNENLFVDQDRNSGQALINKVILNDTYLSVFSKEFRILKDWIDEFLLGYQNLKYLLESESISINESSVQFEQLELLKNQSHGILETLKYNQRIIEGEFKLPLEFKLIKNKDFEVALGFDFKRLNEYSTEYKFIETEPTEPYAVVIVFRRLSEIINQINSLNRFVNNNSQLQVTIIHGNAGMGKSNISVFLYKELSKCNSPTIILNAKSFNGDPDSFEKLFMSNLLVPNNYQIDEVVKKLNDYGEKNKCRIAFIIDGLNETSYAHSGFSKIWENSLDNFIEALERYPYLYLIATLRTSYISRIWQDKSIPYGQIQLQGFKKGKLKELIGKYFKEYKIKLDSVSETGLFYFSTPLYLDLYCKMLNGDKIQEVEPLLGLVGFKQVFDKYLDSLATKTQHKLSLVDTDLVFDGINRVSKEMIDELEAFVPKLVYYEQMEGEKVKKFNETIGYEILEEYLIYLDENLNNKDVIIHTQQEIGGYLLAKKLIYDFGSVDEVVESPFFQDFILGNSGKHHQLKDDILKFLISEADSDSVLYRDYISNDIVKKFITLLLYSTIASEETIALATKLLENTFSLEEVRTLIDDVSNSFYEKDAGINFLFLKQVFMKLGNYDLDFSWTLYIYNHYREFKELLDHFAVNPEELDGTENDNLYVEVIICLSETTIRDLRDKSTRFLLRYYERFPELLLDKLMEYVDTERIYIQERLSLTCYGVCMRLQNDTEFVQNHLGTIANSLYVLQFSLEPNNPTYNYIVIDSYKHIIDLAISKGVFELADEDLERLSNYVFNKDDWFEINEDDMKAVNNAVRWHSSPDPDPLSGDFVHYTIPRLDNLSQETRNKHTANIYKEILRLGYIPNASGISESEQSFYWGNSLIGSQIKVDRLGKKYSWIAYFNYAGYLLSQNKLGVWEEEDSTYERHYERLSDTEIEPSYDEYIPISERLVDFTFFKNRTMDNGNWVNEPYYKVLNELYQKENYTLLSAFVDQKLDENYKTRSWVEAKSFFVDKNQITEHIPNLVTREFDWQHELHGQGTLYRTYFGELYWADTIAVIKKDSHNLTLEFTKEVTRTISYFEVRESGEFNHEDVGEKVTETVNETCNFEYEQTLIDFIWETNSKQIPTLRCDIPAPNFGKHLGLTVDSANTKILDSNLELCFKEYFTEYELNSENFHYFRTDLLQKYLEETGQVLMYQLKQNTYDQATDTHHEHFRGMQFLFSHLNR